ncbi:Stage III sporulation protein AE [Eubacterium plexicaudatum ASF492]|uniref:Stage III sporulation protein AE n=1 Tax=Eubacterium plexicaudatum ASF492 TaxID=1235802 RepID=N2A2L6_9FIRM|nr:Stage III sporulation protein AE [Eubacterium plexicaudatum ASF492]
MKLRKQTTGTVWAVMWTIIFLFGSCDHIVQAGQEAYDTDAMRTEAQQLLSDLGLSDIDAYLQQEDLGQITFSQLVQELMSNGVSFGFASIGETLKQAVFADYYENRSVLIQILMLALAFSILLQMTSSIQKKYISDLGFLGVYLILMMLLLRLFMLMTGSVENFFTKLVDFMRVLQPAFCLSMVFSSGSISAGAYYQLLLLLIHLIDTVFAKILLPVVQVYMVLQLVNYLTQERFSGIAGLLADSVSWCIKLFTTALVGLNIVQGLLAPGIDGLKRSLASGAVRSIPGAGQMINSMTEILAGSALLIKNSVGVAALLILIVISFLPLVKTAVFMVLYRACAAFMEPMADKRFCAAVSALGQSAALYLKLMFYAVLLFFLTTAIICAATSISV